jgi:hypothetical protein
MKVRQGTAQRQESSWRVWTRPRRSVSDSGQPQRQQRSEGRGLAAGLALGLLLGGVATPVMAQPIETLKLELTPSSPELAACMPDAKLDVKVALKTDRRGFDRFEIHAQNLPPDRAFTVFLLEQAGSPFGAAEYIGDFSTNAKGNARNAFQLIVQEAFASTLVNGERVRADLNRIGVWFADPADDEFCLPESGATPFDGDNEAGVQVFNSANAEPLPAP